MKNTTTVQALADLASMSVDTFLIKIKGELGDDIPAVHDWTHSTKLNDQQSDKIIDWLGLDEQRGDLTIDTTSITQADEAVKEAKIQLVESLKINYTQTIEDLTTQAKAIGITGGINAGIEMIDGFITGQERVTNVFIDESWNAFEDQKDRIDQASINLATRTQERLGKAVRNRETARKRISALNEQISKLLD